MHRLFRTIILYGFIVLAGCTSDRGKRVLHFEMVGDTLFVGNNGYNAKFALWKQTYEECLHSRLFGNAFYLGLQENIQIGSINNLNETNVSKNYSVFDTSNRKNISNLFAQISQANCYTKVNEGLRFDFYKELIKSLKNSGQYAYLIDFMDSSKIIYTITSMAENSLRPDSLASLLQRTNDSSLLRFKKILDTPGNALLVRTEMLFGFLAEFPLKKRLLGGEAANLKNEVVFKNGDFGENSYIKILPNERLQIFINKYYTVFGQFFVLKEGK